MKVQNDYTIAIKTIATQNKKLFELTSVERENITYLYARENHINLCRDNVVQKLILNFYCKKKDMTSTGVNIMGLIHREIIKKINDDLDEELSDLKYERDKFELIYSANNFKWHPEDNFSFWNEIYDDNDSLQFENDLKHYYAE